MMLIYKNVPITYGISVDNLSPFDLNLKHAPAHKLIREPIYVFCIWANIPTHEQRLLGRETIRIIMWSISTNKDF